MEKVREISGALGRPWPRASRTCNNTKPLYSALGSILLPKSLSHRPVGELTNPGVGAMGLKRGRPVQFHRPLVGPREGSSASLSSMGSRPSPKGLGHCAIA